MNLLDIFQELNITYRTDGEHHHARSGWIQTDCPECSPGSGRFRLGFNLAYNYASCWSCGPKRLWKAVLALSEHPESQVLPLLQQLERTTEQEAKPIGKLKLPKAVGPLQKPHVAYLRERGFKVKEVAPLWKLQGINHLGGRLAWRIFIPVYFRGKVVTWTTRSIAYASMNPEPLRYVTATAEESSLPRNQVLYGLDLAKWAIAITEGPIDAWAIGPGAVATLGTSYSQQQVALMAKFPVRAVCFDNEDTAQARARKLVDQLCSYPGQTLNIVFDAKDPASAPKRDIEVVRKQLGL